jgi:GT2 family glycosyltransferase
MIVSVEVPVIRGGWLIQCMDSVLQQTSLNWVLSLRWDDGDELSRKILENIEALHSPRIQVHFGSRLGIARARQFLTDRSHGELILPLDDDDVLEPTAVARFLTVATERPWAGLLRARRGFIDDQGEPIEMDDWFPFERRHYLRGATLDIANHAHPYAIRRDVFARAGGWQGFEDYEYFGEDCNCFATIEELAEVELMDEILYRYRIHGSRTSLRFSQPSANELWRRIADEALRRRAVPARRVNEGPPFQYAAIRPSRPSVADVDAVIPFWESDEREVTYGPARPSDSVAAGQFVLRADTQFSQICDPPIGAFHRLEVALSAPGPIEGVLSVAFFRTPSSFSPSCVLRHDLRTTGLYNFEFVSLQAPQERSGEEQLGRLEIAFQPSVSCRELVVLHTVNDNGRQSALMRFFVRDSGHCRRGLERSIASLLRSGVERSSLHIIEKRQPSSLNRNEAFRECSKPWICFMDDDAELRDSSTLSRLLETMTETGASLCGPKLLHSSRWLYSGVPFMNPLTLEARVGGMGDVDDGQHDTIGIVPWLPSTVLLLHRSVMLATGGFDELYLGSQHEDADFSLRARARGFSCCYNGEAAAIHYNELRNARFSRNAEYFRSRWRNRPDLFLPEPGVQWAAPWDRSKGDRVTVEVL